MARVLVTGGTGDISSRRVTDPLAAGQRGLTLALADLTAEAGRDGALAGCDHVLHVASPRSGAVDGEATPVAAAREGARRVLGWQPRAQAETIVDSARCLLDAGS